MKTDERLVHALGAAYRAQVLGHSIDPHHVFRQHAIEDGGFMAAAQTEHDRLVSVGHSLGGALAQRDFAAAQHLQFLKTALANKR